MIYKSAFERLKGVIHIYLCYAEETRIKRLEEDYELHTDHQFYLTVFTIMTSHDLFTRFEDVNTMMKDALKLYNKNAEFRQICYTNGIKPRMEKHLKSDVNIYL
jgi:hypothetical protein